MIRLNNKIGAAILIAAIAADCMIPIANDIFMSPPRS
ncbi:hypothetical protein SDC9_140300 [bioreactor metagenome]|uniref:Uncharacterized protein n=1 Tax=bioreactor metagenome TaxID=1076179 RepID=A0A645DUG4_9ZZZZ